MRATLLLLGFVVIACETPPPAAPPSAAPPPTSPGTSATPGATTTPVTAPVVDAGPALVVAPAGPPPICAQLDAASALAPATERDGVTRTVSITRVTESFGDFEGSSGETTLYPSGVYRYTRMNVLSAAAKKNGYYRVTNRPALQATFDDMAASAALSRVVKDASLGGSALSLPAITVTTTVTTGADEIRVPARMGELPSEWIGTNEPAGLSKPGIVGHHVADLKVLHALRFRTDECAATFTPSETQLLRTLRNAAPSETVSPAYTPGSNPLPVAPPVLAMAHGEVVLGSTTSSPSVSNADRVVAGMRPRFRACYNKDAGADLTHGGKIKLRAKLSPSGEVDSATALENQGFSAALELCLRRVVTNATFDAPGGTGATVDISMTLTPPPPAPPSHL